MTGLLSDDGAFARSTMVFFKRDLLAIRQLRAQPGMTRAMTAAAHRSIFNHTSVKQYVSVFPLAYIDFYGKSE
jgi:hypothetical protein